MTAFSLVVQAELRKLTTVRLWRALLLGGFVLAFGYAVLYGIMQESTARERPPFDRIAVVASMINSGNDVTKVLALIFGALAIGNEYRYRTMRMTYLATPNRGRAVLAKIAAVLVSGLSLGVVTVLAGIAALGVMILAFGGSTFVDQPTMWRAVVGGVAAIALWAWIGFGIAAMIKNSLVATLTVVVFGLVEPMISQLFADLNWLLAVALMPSGATRGLIGVASGLRPLPEVAWFPWWASVLVLIAWGAVGALAGMITTVRRDQ